MKRDAVAALRSRLAKQSIELAAKASASDEKFIRLWESFCYEPNCVPMARLDAAAADLVAAIRSKDPVVAKAERRACLKRFVAMLVKGGFLKRGSELGKLLGLK